MEIVLDTDFTDKTPVDRLYTALGRTPEIGNNFDYTLLMVLHYSNQLGLYGDILAQVNAFAELEMAYRNTYSSPKNII